MKHPFIFKGIDALTGKWVEGSLIIDEYEKNYYIGQAIVPKNNQITALGRRNGKTACRFVGIGFSLVIPETVGQHTGLYDIDHRAIFEGDILESTVRKYAPSLQCINRIVVMDIRYMKGLPLYCGMYRVVGNVHDSPELLGPAKEDRPDGWSAKITTIDELHDEPTAPKCDSWHASDRYLPGASGECWGTMERDPCKCGGDRSKCDYYPEVRERAEEDD